MWFNKLFCKQKKIKNLKLNNLIKQKKLKGIINEFLKIKFLKQIIRKLK